MRYLYSGLFYLSIPFILLRLLWRARKSEDYRYRWRERFGLLPKDLKTKGIWLHAVSLGETLAAVPLIRALQKAFPDLAITVTTMTPTGSNRVKAVFEKDVQHFYVPYDLPIAVNHFLDAIQPKIAIMVETELWPNIFHYCHQRDIPVLIANARISLHSFKGYKRVSRFIKPMLDNINIVAAQSQLDVGRFIEIGVEAERVKLIGNIKFDLEIQPSLFEKAELLKAHWGNNRSIWVVASTHEGEDEIILKAFKRVKRAVPSVLLVLVPRHPERFDKVEQLCQKPGYKVLRHSSGEACHDDTDIILGDTIGDLMGFYAACDVAYIGGSLVPHGGHNMIEPASCKVPIITGQHVDNFLEIYDCLEKADAIQMVHNAQELEQIVTKLLQDVELREKLGEKAFQVIQDNHGAVARHVAAIEKLIS